MVEEALQSSPAKMADQPLTTTIITTPPNDVVEPHTSKEADVVGGTDSTFTANNAGETSDSAGEKSLELEAELAEKGKVALKENDFAEAVDCFSRALEIRVSHYGELSLECVNAYYQYGRALLYKAQEEADPLVTVPKKENETKKDGDNEGSVKDGESSTTALVSSVPEEDEASNHPGSEGAAEDAAGEQEQEEADEDSDDEDLAEGDEDESDLDLAWKMLDVARAIAEKNSGDTMDKVDILSALAEVALEREDIETSLSDYQKALDILGKLVEPDSRYIAELNFRICLCLEIGSKPQEAIPYCQKAISVCKSRLQRLANEIKTSSESAVPSAAPELDKHVHHSSNGSQINKSIPDKEAEIETLTGLSGELEKKLEDLQQLALNPKSILSEILGMVSSKAKGGESSSSAAVTSSSRLATVNSGKGFDSPTFSTAHTNGAAGVTHLGVVGRGVKRVLTSTGTSESSPAKKSSLDPSSNKEDGNSC